MLFTGHAPRFLRRSALSSVPSAASARPLWSVPGKVADSRVARYLAAHEALRVPTHHRSPADDHHPHTAALLPRPEFPLLAIFAGLIVVAMIPICLVIAVPSVLTLIAALATVIVFAIAVCWMLGRIIGPEA